MSRPAPTVWALIPARGGSKGVPRKNIRPLLGMPLLEYTARAARDSGVFSRILLSTEDPEIAAVGERLGIEVPYLRPAELARDETAMIDVILNVMERLGGNGQAPDILVLLQPTSPLRRPEHIREAVKLLWESDADSAVTVSPVPLHLCPHYVMRIENGSLTHFLPEGRKITRRQDVVPAYVRNGTVYAMRVSSLMRNRNIYGDRSIPIVMSTEESLSIDTLDDWKLAEARLSGTKGST